MITVFTCNYEKNNILLHLAQEQKGVLLTVTFFAYSMISSLGLDTHCVLPRKYLSPAVWLNVSLGLMSSRKTSMTLQD